MNIKKMENKQEFDKCIKDIDLMSAICTALRLSANSKAEKDCKKMHEVKVLEEDRRDC